MESIEMFGRDAQLHAALRRCAPQVAASLERDERDLPRVRVTYRHTGPWTVSWDGVTYRWRTGPVGTLLPHDAEQAAQRRVRYAAFWDGFAWLKMPVEDAERLMAVAGPIVAGRGWECSSPIVSSGGRLPIANLYFPARQINELTHLLEPDR